MNVLVVEDFKYSLDGHSVLKACKDDVLVLDDAVANRYIGHGYVKDCIIGEKEVDSVDFMDDVDSLLSPVEETKVLEPVEKKKRGRKKKA